MDKGSRYNKIIFLLCVVVVFLLSLFLLPMIEIKDLQFGNVTRFLKDNYHNYTVKECQELLGEPVYITDNERCIYFDGGKTYSVGYISKYKEYDFYITFDENNKYVESAEHFCKMEITYGLSTLLFP